MSSFLSLLAEVDKPFLLAVEDVFSIKGRGTVATGRIERGVMKVGDACEIIGLTKEPLATTVTGVEMFNKTLDQGQLATTLVCCFVALRRIRLSVVRLSASPSRSSLTRVQG